jgi:Ca2+-binding RTX toxin-like protein
MDQSTLTTSTFTLTKLGSSIPLAATVSYDAANKKATLDPASDLEAKTSYTARVTGGAGGAKDPAGNALAQDYSWTFITASPPAPSCTIIGTANAETVSGTSGDDIICAGGGNDTVKGLGGNDTLMGGTGKDKVVGGGGADTLEGEDGADTVNSKDGVNRNDSLDGGLGTDTKVTDSTEKSVVGFP